MHPLTTPDQRLIAAATRKQPLQAWETCSAEIFVKVWLPIFNDKSRLWTDTDNLCECTEPAILNGFHHACAELDRLQPPSTVEQPEAEPEPEAPAIVTVAEPVAQATSHLKRTQAWLTQHGRPATLQQIAEALGLVRERDVLSLNTVLHRAAQGDRVRKAGEVRNPKGRPYTLWTVKGAQVAECP